MKSFGKKRIFLIVMLVLLVNMVSFVFAGTYEWTDGGIYIANVTATGNYITREYQLDNEVFHATNYQNFITIPAGTSKSCNAETSFPLSYKSYLNQALRNEGFRPVDRYYTTYGEDVLIDGVAETGVYVAIIVFEGRGGEWWIQGANNSEVAPSTLDTGTYTFAPSDHYTIARKVY